MAYALITSSQAAAAGPSSPADTSAVDTTGANLIVCKASYNWSGTGGILTDSYSNIWTPLTEYGSSSAFTTTRLFYSYAPTVGSGHTFSFDFGTNGYVNLQMLAFSGAAASPFDQENGNITAGSNDVYSGAVTPSEDNCLLITGVSTNWGAGTDPDLATPTTFTVQEVSPYGTNVNYAGAVAYEIQTTATPRDELWVWTNFVAAVGVMASFKAAAGGSGKPYLYYAQQRQGAL